MLSQTNEDTFLDGSTFEVRLLLSEIQEARKISAIFRQAQIIPHIYEEFAEFYKDFANSKTPSLCIIDVKKMSQGMIKLKNLPGVKNESIHLAFYYSDDALPLLYSTYEIFNFGLIRKSDDYGGQIKSVLRRYNTFRNQDYQVKLLNDEMKEIKATSQQTFELLEEQREKNHYQDRLFKILEEFEKEKNNINFFEAMEDVFMKVEEIKGYSYMELSTNGLKLLSPPSGNKKFRKLPSLWLGQELHEGIEFFAQNMANQVALEVFGADVMCLTIKGRLKNPEALIFVKVDNEDFLNQFRWNTFEDYLSNVFTYFYTQKMQEPNQISNHLDGFLFLEKLDENRFFQNKSENLYLVDVNLADLANLIAKKPELRFYWKDFYLDFTRSLRIKYSGDFYYTTTNAKHLSFLVESEKSELFLRSIKEFAKRFSYWKYFEDREFIFTKDLDVVVRSLPVSSFAYLSYVNNAENVYANLPLSNSAHTTTSEVVQ